MKRSILVILGGLLAFAAATLTASPISTPPVTAFEPIPLCPPDVPNCPPGGPVGK